MNEVLELYEGHSIEIRLKKFEKGADGVKSPDNFEGTHTFIIYHDIAHIRPALTFTEADGITKAGNEMTVTGSIEKNTLKTGVVYCALHNDLDESTSFPEAQFSIPVKPSRRI